jgi:hypothetical protein
MLDASFPHNEASVTFGAFRQPTAVESTTTCGQLAAAFAFLAERLVFMAGLVR